MYPGEPITKKLSKMYTGEPITIFLRVNQLGLKSLRRSIELLLAEPISRQLSSAGMHQT